MKGGAVALWLVRATPERAVRVRALPCFVFSQLQLFNYKQSHFALASSFAILRNARSSYGKVFPVSTAEKLQRGNFFARTLKA